MKVKHALAVFIPSFVVLGFTGVVVADVKDVSKYYLDYKMEQDYDTSIQHLSRETDKGYTTDSWSDTKNKLTFKTVRKEKYLSGIIKNSYLRDLLKKQVDSELTASKAELTKLGFVYQLGAVNRGNIYSHKAIAVPLVSVRDVTLYDFDKTTFDKLFSLVKVMQRLERPNSYYLDIKGADNGRIILSNLKGYKSADDIRQVLRSDVRSKMLQDTKNK